MIGGNAQLKFRTYGSYKKNAIGERIPETDPSMSAPVTGFLDLISGDSKYLPGLAKMEESTHVFVCDYQPLKAADGTVVNPSTSQAVVGKKLYAIQLIDDPMELHDHIEIFLKLIGGVDDV